MSREEFSALIAGPTNGLFPARLYAEGSAFLDATHWMINAQLGEIGGWLNQAMFGNEVAALGWKLREANLPFAYGLRGTLPEVVLKGGAGGDPFYILRKVPNERLLPGDSSFEMARADMFYLEFLWKKSGWEAIVVDVEATLKSSQALFWLQDGQWHVRAGYGIAVDYVRLFHPSIKLNLQGLEPEVRKDLNRLLEKLRPYAASPKVQPILQVGEVLPVFFEPHAEFILGYGDVHLLRVDADGIADAVEDRLGNPLVLPNQVWLVLYGHTREKAEEWLKRASAIDLEEIIYDWNTLQVPGSLGLVLLDRVAGACFYVYRRLVDYACS